MYRGDKTVSLYVAEVKKIMESLKKEKKVLGGMIIEPIISCGGQIELPKGFLKETFDEVRKADGICIVDEVQTGCGRVGSHFWGFQLHDVIPDIITIGKPLGNGHPIAAVACTQKVAEGFNNGMEFFNTFGGNPVSCAIAKTVLEVIEDEKLQENSLVVGNFLKTNLLELSSKYSIIGSVRGQGLFLGVEFVNKQLQPLAEQADYFVNRMKSYGILLSTDGPDHNVIKIKPPLVFSMQNAKDFLKYFTLVLQEDLMQSN
jgi:4-aminobutyrate aminotransferase-like enzyme